MSLTSHSRLNLLSNLAVVGSNLHNPIQIVHHKTVRQTIGKTKHKEQMSNVYRLTFISVCCLVTLQWIRHSAANRGIIHI